LPIKRRLYFIISLVHLQMCDLAAAVRAICLRWLLEIYYFVQFNFAVEWDESS
jgi:hypothetical protein